MISESYIRSSAIRAKFNELLSSNSKFSKWEKDLITKRALTYHDDRGNVYKNALVEPHFALTSELQYWINRDGARLPNWWDVCDILVGYWIYNLTTGNAYSAATETDISAYIRSLDSTLDEWKIQSTLATFARHASDIQYGSYLFKPSVLIGSVGNGTAEKKSNMKGLALAAGLTTAFIAISKAKR